eukprot:GFUD01015841.1.p1 GENE.GFUD01015841.1~~GFUD01015841.1.p1  ORF type:complete len:304 (-),score=79.71 GFUD01015841.1:470-1381(-)
MTRFFTQRFAASLREWNQTTVSYQWSSCDPGSEVFSRMNLNRKKVSEVVRFGLYPSMKQTLVRRVKEGGGTGGFFTTGLDSSTIKHLGIQKHCDINIRYWNEAGGQVEDGYLDTHVVGHEPAVRQVNDLNKTFTEMGIPLTKMVGLSRDNPRVMEAVSKLFRSELADKGNPGVVDLICYLHPCHTAFEKCCESLTKVSELEEEEGVIKIDISTLLSSIHGFFNSPARREDLTDVGEELYDKLAGFEENLNKFFKRHVSTRWLEMGPCLESLLDRWTSTVHYFTAFLPNSKDSSDKKALKTDRY